MSVAIARPAEEREARARRAYDQLRELIVRGELAPGARLVEMDVARQLGVSRTPVRGALQRLAHEGYVVESPGLRQMRPAVAPVTREDADELFHIVGVIEGLAAFRAAGLPEPERLALAAELARINEGFRRASVTARPDHDRLFDLDERFHRTYVENGAGPRLRALHDAVKPQAERYERLYVSMLTTEIHQSVKEHAAIVRAIRAGRDESAQRAVESNWRNAARRLGGVIGRATAEGRGW